MMCTKVLLLLFVVRTLYNMCVYIRKTSFGVIGQIQAFTKYM
jgi:hypothetical protein